ncbi:quinone-dependent dihydroorotate dehydrogenase [Ulvibacterium sp.]|uniref:quinone-dependent dihydroorotate dehydrogenase n=1 Tax=Ulvibacterium sp. TaxID=2665914 RepID=UPI002628A845|nr:quinone-dependent dihydroorotate dehydrogenase [Ulvibacterium sp.]
MYKFLVRPFLFLLDAERAHHLIFSLVRFLSKIGFSKVFKSLYTIEDKRLERQVFGLKFKNPVGLAAGFDKDALLYNQFSNFGFGFVEIGTLTPKPQKGNPKKRLFRLKADEAIINRMGFNNKGVFDAVERLKKEHNVLVGGNIGKNKVTPNDDAIKDYLICFDALFDHVDYFAVNVSSPNTPGLRELQGKKPLVALLRELKKENVKYANDRDNKEKPILLKIAPDLTDNQLLDIIQIVETTKIDGIIATNTTIERKNLKSDLVQTEEKGGLSGKPLRNKSTDVIRFLAEKSNKAFPIIGVGGIHSPDDALEKLDAGADLVQLYTGFIYEGPSLVRQINKAILKKAEEEGD